MDYRYLIALDPGLIHPAIAIFTDGFLEHASRVTIPDHWKKMKLGQRMWLIAEGIENHLARILGYGETDCRLVVEYPQIYTADKSKGNPNNLTPLAGIGMCLAGLLRVAPDVVLPKEWAGTTPKAETGDPWSSVRGQMVWNRLDEVERFNVVPSHDAIDSVGIGLWRLGRFNKRRVYDRA